MSVEVEPKVNGEVAAAAVAESALVPTAIAPKPALWRRRPIQIAAFIAVVALIAGAVGTNFLVRQYSPDGVTRDYLSALQSGNADAAWGVMQVSAAPTPTAASLTGHSALQAALRTKPDIKSFAVSGVQQIDSNRATVSFAYDTSIGSKQGQFVVVRSGENRFGLIPDWRVVIVPTVLRLTLPAAVPGVSIDGHALALSDGTFDVAVLPVPHTVDYGGTTVLSEQQVTVDAFMSAGQSVAYEPRLTTAGAAAAAAAVKAGFTACAQKTELQPSSCPQSDPSSFHTSPQWQVIGDPTQNMSLTFDQDLKLEATGHFQMVDAYQEQGVSGTGHDISASGYRAALGLSASNITVLSITTDNQVGSLERPAGATDQAAEDLVSKAMTRCASLAGEKPADCPQDLFSSFAENVHWSLNGNPLAGAGVSFDPATGIFTITGTFQMTAHYDISGYARSDASDYDHYSAYLLWDGQALQLVTIAGGFS